MPSKSEKQHKFMVMACKDAQFAKEHNIDQKVACEFVEADKKAKEAAEKKGEKPPFSKWGDKK